MAVPIAMPTNDTNNRLAIESGFGVNAGPGNRGCLLYDQRFPGADSLAGWLVYAAIIAAMMAALSCSALEVGRNLETSDALIPPFPSLPNEPFICDQPTKLAITVEGVGGWVASYIKKIGSNLLFPD